MLYQIPSLFGYIKCDAYDTPALYNDAQGALLLSKLSFSFFYENFILGFFKNYAKSFSGDMLW